jgi:hypothetical protein
MTIEIHQPELRALIQERLQSGAFHDVEEVLLHALKTSEPQPAYPAHGADAENLADLFANSPFAGLDLDFERDRDTGREIDL